MTGLTTLETRRLVADTVEVYTILRCFEKTDDLKFFQRRVASTRGHDFKLYKN